jgi:hypothetical protein
MPQGMKWYVSRPEYAADMAKYDTLWREMFKLRG